MDNMLRDIAELLDLVEDRLEKYQADLDESEWSNFDDHFRLLRRVIKSKILTIDELIRWD